MCISKSRFILHHKPLTAHPKNPPFWCHLFIALSTSLVHLPVITTMTTSTTKTTPKGPMARLNPAVFYVNADTRTQRRKSLESIFAERHMTKTKRIPAVFPHCCPPNECCSCGIGAKVSFPKGRTFTGEIGIIVAFLDALRAVWNSGEDWALVLEDDVDFRYEPWYR